MVVTKKLDGTIDQFVEEIIAQGGGAPVDPMGIQSPKQYASRLKLQFKDAYIELFHMVQTGYQHLLAEMELLKENVGDYKVSDKILAHLKDKDKVRDRIAKGEGIQQLVGFTDEQMIHLYRTATQIFKDQRYNAALEAFCFLTYLNPLNPCYWEAMGVSLEKDHRPSEAFQVYVAGLLLNSTSFDLWRKAFSCSFRGQNEQEKEFIINGAKKVIEFLENKHSEPDFCNDLKQLLTQISK